LKDFEIKTCSSYESVDEDKTLIVKIPTPPNMKLTKK